MTVTLPARRTSGQSLRELAESMDELPGYRVEIIEGAVVVSPTPAGAHAGVVRRIERRIERQLSGDRVTAQVLSVDSGRGEVEYVTPDIAVLPAEIEQSTAWVFPAEIVDLVAEVVSPGSAGHDLRNKPVMYGDWGIAIYLLVDPRDGTIVLYSDPVDGVYRGVHRMRFGDVVELPAPLKGITIETGDLARYRAAG